MGERVVCRECGVDIEISSAVSDDTVVFCDECGAEYNPIPGAEEAIRNYAVEVVKGDINKMPRRVARKHKNIAVQER